MENGKCERLPEGNQNIEAWCAKHLHTIRRSGNRLRAYCPKCNGNDFWLHFAKDGCFKCWNCDWKGSFRALCERFNDFSSVQFTPSIVEEIEVDRSLLSKAAQDIYNLSILDEYTDKYLKERGIHYPERFGLKTIPEGVLHSFMSTGWTEETLINSGLFTKKYGRIYSKPIINPGRLFIPYYSCSLENVFGFITRRRHGEIGSSGPYMIPKGAPSAEWIWSDFRDKEVSSWCIVTEGQLKAISVRERGLPCIGLQGCHGGKVGLPKELNRIQCKKVFIIFDTESTEEKQKTTELSAQHLADYLKDFKVEIKWLPKNGHKQDLDSFLKENSAIKLLELLR